MALFTLTAARHYYRCTVCLAVAVIETDDRFDTLTCGICGGRLEWMGRVEADRMVRDELRVPCDSRCTGARGPFCSCKCSGKNHGSNLVVSVRTYDGQAPAVTPKTNEAKYRRQAEEFRGAVSEAEGAIKSRWGGIIQDKIAGKWIPNWSDYMTATSWLASLRKAKEAREHTGRMKMLRGIVEQVRGAA